MSLAEQMPAPLPTAEAVGIVQHRFGVHVMVERAVRVSGVGLAILDQTLHQRVGRERGFLIFEGARKRVLRYARGVVWHLFLPE